MVSTTPFPKTLPQPSEDALQAQVEWVNETQIPQFQTRATFKLIDVTGDLTTDYVIETSSLKIPTGYDLTAT